jgi:hypothetical protein
MSTAQENLAAALTRALADFGIRGVSDPARLRAALVDLLGAEARVLRPEIDAVVAAATADVPGALLADVPPDGDALIARLTARDVPLPFAAFAVSAWAQALAPFMSTTIEVPSVPTAPTIVPLITPTIVPGASGPVSPGAGTESMLALPATVLPPEELGDFRRGSRRALVLAIAAIVAIVAIAGTAWALSSGGDPKKVAVVNTTSTHAKSPTQTTKTRTSTTKKHTPTTRKHTPTTKRAPTTTFTPAPQPQPQPQPEPVPAPAPAPLPVPAPIPAPAPAPNPVPPPSVQTVPTTTKKTAPPTTHCSGCTQPVAADIYTSIYSCWDGSQWESHYLGMTAQLPAGWTYVTTPSGQVTNYGTLGYANSDYWYQPDSRYGGNYNDAFYYAYKNAQGVWSTWAVTHIAISAVGTC